MPRGAIEIPQYLPGVFGKVSLKYFRACLLENRLFCKIRNLVFNLPVEADYREVRDITGIEVGNRHSVSFAD